MSSITELHKRAMDLAETAFVAQQSGDSSRAQGLFRDAFALEAEAAERLEREYDAEPSRSILYRSAASLALDCGELEQAERLIHTALTGHPPADIAEELRDLLEQVSFQRHLDLRGITLEPSELQVSIAGEAIGFGIAPSDEVLDRVKKAQTLVYRTVERLAGRPYTDQKKPPKGIRDDYSIFLSTPRAASFAVSIRVGRPHQPELTGMEYIGEIIEEIVKCIELFNKSKEELRERLADEAYYRNFVWLVRTLAPDGERVKTVGFTAVQNGIERRVALTKPRDEIELIPKTTSDTSEAVSTQLQTNRVTFTGELRFADSTSESEGKIKIIDENGKEQTVSVPRGMMSDIVRPLYEEIVTVIAVRRGRLLELEDITPVKS